MSGQPWYTQFRKFVVPEFVFGVGCHTLAGRNAANLKINKCFVVSDETVAAYSWTARVIDNLSEHGIESVVYTGVTPNPRDFEVMAAAQQYLSEDCDGIVAVGGGSPMDLAKAVGIVVTNDRHVLEFAGVDQVDKPSPPLICLPTTAGTGAEVSQFSIIRDTPRSLKIAIVSKTVIPDVALLDPLFTTSMDPELSAATGLDALTHAIEAYVSNASSPVTDTLALAAIRLIKDNLITAIREPDNLEARSSMMLGSLKAGMAFSNAILGAVHALSHSLGGYLDLPHGLCNAILLDHVVDANFDAVPERYRDIAYALGAPLHKGDSEDTVRQILLESLRELKRRAGVTADLGLLGVDHSVARELALRAEDDPCILTNPKDLTVSELTHILEQAGAA